MKVIYLRVTVDQQTRARQSPFPSSLLARGNISCQSHFAIEP